MKYAVKKRKQGPVRHDHPRRFIVLAFVLVIGAFLSGSLLVHAQFWTRPQHQPPQNNDSGQPPTISNIAEYLQSGVTTPQVTAGPITGATISNVPLELGNAGGKNSAIRARNSFGAIPSTADPSGNTGIQIYTNATGTEYGLYAVAEGTGTSYAVYGKSDSTGKSSGFFGPVSVEDNGAAKGTFQAVNSLVSDHGIKCFEAAGCVIPSTSVNAISAVETGSQYAVSGNSGSQFGIAGDFGFLNANGYGAKGIATNGVGIYGAGSIGIYGTTQRGDSTDTVIAVAGFSTNGGDAFSGRVGVYGRSDGGLGHVYTTQNSDYVVADGAPYLEHSQSVVVGFDGNPVIAYYSSNNGNKLIFIHCTNENCSSHDTPLTLATGDAGQWVDMKIDKNGHPVIVYFKSTATYGTYLIHCKSSNCANPADGTLYIDTPILLDTNGLMAHMALNQNGYPVISYEVSGTKSLMLIYCASENCSSPEAALPLAVSTLGIAWNSIAIDKDNHPVISYYDFNGSALKYIHCKSANCKTGAGALNIDGPTSLDNVGGGSAGTWNAMTVDQNSRPIIVYVNTSSGVNTVRMLRCADEFCVPATNTKTTIDSYTGATPGHTTGEIISIKVDAANRPIISYYFTAGAANSSHFLKFAYCSLNCTTLTPTMTGFVIISSYADWFNSLTINKKGLPVISYAYGDLNLATNKIHIYHCVTNTCRLVTSQSYDMAAGVVACTKTSDGYIESITNQSGVKGTGGKWAGFFDGTVTSSWINPVPSTIDYTDQVGRYTSIALDSSDNPAISYYDETNKHLKFVKCGNPSCSGSTPITLDPATAVGEYTSIALDSNNIPAISYYARTLGKIRLIRCISPDCSSANSPQDIGNVTTLGSAYSSIAFDSSNIPAIAYYNDAGPSGYLQFFKCGNLACSSGNTTNPIDALSPRVGKYLSMALDSDNIPAISYFDWTNGALKFVKCIDATCSSTNPPRLLDSTIGAFFAGFTSLALDSYNIPAISYYSYNNGSLKFVKCIDATCSSNNPLRTLDTYSIGYGSGYTSIALDNINIPAISYYDPQRKYLKFVKCIDATCSSANPVRTLDITSDVGSYTSLALDSNNIPTMSYYDGGTNLDLKFVKCGTATCGPLSYKVPQKNTTYGTWDGGLMNIIGNGYLQIGNIKLTKRNLACLLWKAGYAGYQPLCQS